MSFDVNINPAGKQGHKSKKVKTAKEITTESIGELSEQALLIHKQEGKLEERMAFDGDRAYFFSIVFESTGQRENFCKSHGIDLHSDAYVFYDEIKDKFREV